MKNYLFFTKYGFTFDSSYCEVNNLRTLGTGVGIDVNDAFISFKEHQSYLFEQSFRNVTAGEYVGDFILNLELLMVSKDSNYQIPKATLCSFR